MANQEHVSLLKQGVEVWNAWREEHLVIDPDLREANLVDVNLREANLIGANISNTDLRFANLHEANLSYANLRLARLSYADLSYANLSYADLSHANLNRTRLDQTNICNVTLGSTQLDDIDLRRVKGIETVKHELPSSIGFDTIIRSQGAIPQIFLRGAGLSDTLIDYLPSLLATAIEYYSLFIAYSNPDEVLARRLYKDLQNKGVRCWMAPHDLRPGDYHHSRIDEAIRVHEKVLLLLSEHAVNSSWVKHEVQVAMTREITQDCTVLFPLRLDQAVMQTSKDWAVQLRESRHIGDFIGWQDENVYRQALVTLLRHLKVMKPPTN